jgi:hypothetical protein
MAECERRAWEAPARYRFERPLPGAGVLGEGAHAVGVQVGEHLVARPKPGHGRSDDLHDARDIQPEAVVPRRAHPDEEAHEGRLGCQSVEIRPVHGRGMDPHEHLVVRRRRTVHP